MHAKQPCPSELLYNAEHDWVALDGEIATFGVTCFAQEQLGEIVFWSGPKPGEQVVQGEPYAELESVKAVSDVIAPLSGEVVEVNGALADRPDLVNSSPYKEGWLVKVRVRDGDETSSLLDVETYEEMLP